MVQIHEAPQSFGQGLIQSLAGAGAEVAKGLQQRNANQALAKLHDQARAQNQIDPDTGEIVKQPISPAKKPINTSAIYNQAIAAGKSEAQARQEIQPYLDQQKLEAQEASKLRIQKAKEEEAQKKSLAKRERSVKEANKGIQEIEKLVGKKGIGLVSHYLNQGDEAKRNAAKLRTATAPMYHFFKEELFPGRFTDADLKFVTNTFIPQPGDREATIQGKIEAFKTFVKGLDEGAINPQEVQQAASQLTPEITQEIFKEAGGDPARATEIAKERGYQL